MSDGAQPFHLSSMNMKMGTIGGDVIFNIMLSRVCRLEVWDKKLGKLIYYGIKGVNEGDVETTDGGAGACNTSHNYIEVVKTDEKIMGHVNGQPNRSKKISTEDGVCKSGT